MIHKNYNTWSISQMEQGYYFKKSDILDQVSSQSWQDVDDKLPQIPTGVYTFQPSNDELIYYKRLLYCLDHEQQSSRALKLTAYLLVLNTNNYYALMLRTECFKKVLAACTDSSEYQQILHKQLYFTSCLLNKNPKQYQIWNYKKDLISAEGTIKHGIDMQKIRKKEEDYIFYLLNDDDNKNYHAWDYLTWLSRHSSDIEARIKQTDQMLFVQAEVGEFTCKSYWSDCYSCWSYRFNLIKDLPEDIRQKYWQAEIDRVLDYVMRNVSNQCGWNYLEGLLDTFELSEKQMETAIKQVYEKCLTTESNNRLAWSFILNVGSKQMKQRALAKLEIIDSIRELYFAFLREKLF